MGASTPEQVEELIKLKFHEAAGMAEGDFETCAGRPKEKGSGTFLVISESFICVTKQCSLLGIVNKLEVPQLQTHENKMALPKKFLYWCYGVEDGTATRGISSERNIQQLSDSRRFPAHTALALALFRRNRKILDGHNRLDIGGSRVEGSLFPVLLMGNGSVREHHPALSSSSISAADKPTYCMPSFERAE